MLHRRMTRDLGALPLRGDIAQLRVVDRLHRTAPGGGPERPTGSTNVNSGANWYRSGTGVTVANAGIISTTRMPSLPAMTSKC